MVLFILMILNKKTFLIVLPLLVLAELNKLILDKKIKKFLLNIFLIIGVLITANIIERTNSYF